MILEKRNFNEEKLAIDEINNKILVDKIEGINFAKRNYDIKIKYFKEFIKEKDIPEKYSKLKIDI